MKFFFLILISSSSYAGSLPNKLYCGSEYFSCDSSVINTAVVKISKTSTKLIRVFKEGDSPYEATFTGAVLFNGKEGNLILSANDNSIAGGKFADGQAKITVNCDPRKKCKIISKGNLKNWRPDSKENTLRVHDNSEVMAFSFSCNTKAVPVEGPKHGECGSESGD